MANVNVYTGADGSITLSTPEGAEGEAAQGILDAHDLISVGRVTDVKIEVHSEVRAFHEIGQRYATQLRPGNVSIHGTIGRAFLNGAMLRLLLGEAADSRPGSSWAQPAFNITLMAETPSSPGTNNTITLHGVKIDTWNYDMPEDEFVMESVSFQALYMTTADEAA
jgi:hypothetical protein